MGCDILFHMALICSLSSGYHTVYGNLYPNWRDQTRELLTQRDRVYLVGMTDNIFPNPENYKCIITTFVDRTRTHRQLKYLEVVEKGELTEETPEQIEMVQSRQENPEGEKKWLEREVPLTFRIDRAKEVIHIGRKAPLEIGIHVTWQD
ncbi:uncharacterized protein LOC142767570 isoform X2 [Rhipicephalus microplus]|uniref:uncharacterized protein LOC142767570 isoform X2 n=1 Tax=Rhipicephalus microplus TaxID=6941 RepID=UPI003F6CFD72